MTLQHEFLEKRVENMHALPKPLPRSENGNFEQISEQIPRQGTKIPGWSHLSKEELQRRRAEGKRNATPKPVYTRAILRFCHECFGKHPSREDCGGHTLVDGTACNLYPHNTARKCRKSTKTEIKRAVGRECKSCGGDGKESCGKCSLRELRWFGACPGMVS